MRSTGNTLVASVAVVAGLALLGIVFGSASTRATDQPDLNQLGPNGRYPTMRVAADGTAYLIPLEDVTWGGVARDGIPAIDRPHFIRSDRWPHMGYQDDRLVIGVEINGKQRAYPLQVIVFHEIVNDTFEGVPLAVTY